MRSSGLKLENDVSMLGLGHDDSSTESDAIESTETGRKTEEEPFTKSETLLVNRSKLLVYLILLVAAIAVSTVTFIFLSKEQEKTLQAEFEAYSREILKQATLNSENMFEEIWDIGKTITSHALFAGLTWPNVTLPHFDIQARDERSRVEFIGFAPFVTPETREGWEAYSVANQDWIAQDYAYRGWDEREPTPIPTEIHTYESMGDDPWFTGRRNLQANYTEPNWSDYQIPLWQVAPVPYDTSIINMDLASHPVFAHLLWDVKEKKVDQYSRAIDVSFLLDNEPSANNGHPRGTIYQPVFEDFREDAEVVGFMMGILTWDKMFENVLFEAVAPVLVEIEGNCSAGFAYMLTGDEVIFLGAGADRHDDRFEKYKRSADLLAPKNSRAGYPPVKHQHRPTDAAHNESHCTYVMNTYPTDDFEEYYMTNQPIYYTVAILGIFLCTTLVFVTYDWFVQHRQRKLLTAARQTDAIVASLFPKEVQKRMMEEAAELAEEKRRKKRFRVGASDKMSQFLKEDEGSNGNDDQTINRAAGMPIADLFPEATVMFADIVGFTAWSSTREPTQVFVLLETIYNAFDAIAKKKKNSTNVFKVETVGDCYVAVSGLPNPCKDHAVVMARFGRDCLESMQKQLHMLETELGPETTELGIRIGLNSGPITAGVLRGDRARFQLFGDTVNTASRIETTGAKNRIHVSEDTASFLIKAGKESWLQKRTDTVVAKGKGELCTYWLSASGCNTEVDSETSSVAGTLVSNSTKVLNQKQSRLVDWISDTLEKLLRQIVMRREASASKQGPTDPARLIELENFGMIEGTALDEVEDIIKLPKFDAADVDINSDSERTVQLSPNVVAELRSYVYFIAVSYSNNPFHNFEHAGHVTMSVLKLLSRIVAPNIEGPDGQVDTASTLHDHTYGITSDPLTQFAVVLSALIHDVYHPGVPNLQLVKERDDIASFYHNKSIAEQKSVDMAWNLLMEPQMSNLRNAIYGDEDEYKRFRQLVVNSVMATDIMDKELSAARKARWDIAFSEHSVNEDFDVSINRKATIVIEHLIQASDVAHTMQHWHIYRKYNARLFEEMYVAYLDGRSDKNPADNWYEGEQGFFDYYIIPLAKKLKECGVFGVSSDEYLNYAMQNRKEWETKGRDMVAEMIASLDGGKAGSANGALESVPETR